MQTPPQSLSERCPQRGASWTEHR